MITVDFDKGKFIITCPFHENDKIAGLPNKRWHGQTRTWRCPLISRNAEFIAKAGFTLSASAQAAIDEMKANSAAAVRRGGGLPAWYRFKTEAMPHQLDFYKAMYGIQNVALFGKPGTGKSKMIIDFYSAMRMEGKITALLIVVKLSLRDNWVIEFKKHCPIPFDIFLPDTTKLAAYRKWKGQPHDFKILVVGTESLSVGGMYDIAKDFVDSQPKPAAVVDESSKISGHKATRSERCVSLGLSCVSRLASTGSSTRGQPLNLFMQFEFLDPNIIGIGDFYAFRNRYAVMGGYVNQYGKPTQIVGYRNLDELIDTIAPFTYEIPKSVLNLPPRRNKRLVVKMTAEQRKLYNTIRRDKAYDIGGKTMIMANMLELTLRLHQVCGGWTVTKEEVDKYFKKDDVWGKAVMTTPHRVLEASENPKLNELLEFVDDIERAPFILWCAYRPEIADAVAALQARGLRVGQLHGGVPEAERQPAVNAFERGELDCVVGNSSTGGMGYTMNRAEYNIFYSNTNKFEDREQSEDRNHRIGQTKNTTVVDIVMENSVDELLIRANEERLDVSQFISRRLEEAISLLGD